MKAELDKLDINKLINVLTSFNNLKETDDLDIGKLKTVPNLKKLSDIVHNEVVKNTKFITRKTKVNNLEKPIPDAITLIHIDQYKIDKQNLEEKIRDIDKKNTKYNWFSEYNCFEYKKIIKSRIKFLIILNILLFKNLKQADLVNKNDFDNKLTSFNKHITSNNAKHLVVQKELNGLITKGYYFFR